MLFAIVACRSASDREHEARSRSRCVISIAARDPPSHFSATYRRFLVGKSARLRREISPRMRASFFVAFYWIQ
jgi:hypothetical protein